MSSLIHIDLLEDLLLVTTKYLEQVEDVADQIDLAIRSGNARASRSLARGLRSDGSLVARFERATRSLRDDGLRAERSARALRDEELRAELADRAARSPRADRAAR
ncbi:hypothetical protein, partial [Burkholderia ambifaria]|uniref:hypothetical protein n=1 Tax=Burkholderia ambifaria TaxID=152480 RepID=UPI0018E0BC91